MRLLHYCKSRGHYHKTGGAWRDSGSESDSPSLLNSNRVVCFTLGENICRVILVEIHVFLSVVSLFLFHAERSTEFFVLNYKKYTTIDLRLELGGGLGLSDNASAVYPM